jgi:hydroxyacylglutathione hydrolase
MALEIVQVPALTDNYIYLLHDTLSGETAAVDPAVAEPVLTVLKEKNWQLTAIFNTHHHGDHVGGNVELKAKTGCKVTASYSDRDRIPGLDHALSEGDVVAIGTHQATVIATPGHTRGHIVYHFAKDELLFCGDTLFVMGCGRLFEGSAEQLWQSLQKLKNLPGRTRMYCAHEYTRTNGRFALTVEPDNQSLQEKMTRVEQLYAQKTPTVPSTLAEEFATNPFLRETSPAIQMRLALNGSSPIAVFAELRRLKDRF